MRYLISILCILLSALQLNAHKDRVITIQESRLVGLPENYSPASFDYRGAILVIGGKSARLPAYVRDFIAQSKDPTFMIRASWYHDLNVMPPYIHIEVHEKDVDYFYTLLYDLDTVHLRECRVSVPLHDGRCHELPIDLKEAARFESP